MYKSNKTQEKREYLKYSSSKAYNLLSPPYNPKQKTKAYINTNLPKYKPINLYSTYLSPFQSEKNLSVKNINSPDDKVSQNLMNKFSQFQKNNNSKIIGSPNTNNSDLLTAASLTSNESILSNNNSNTSIFLPLNVQSTINTFDICELNKGHRYNYSMINPQININNNFYNMNTLYINGNYSNINNNCIKGKQGFFNQNVNTYMPNNPSVLNIGINNSIKNKKNKNKNNGDKININNYNSNNSSKSKSNSDSNNTDSCKMSSNKSNSNNSIKKGKIYTNPQRKKHYNKFNTTKENNNASENTVILTLKIKVAKNDYRTFNLKKYDDLFISLEKFFDLNKIQQSLVKPIVNQIFTALNKIFSLLNNKIGKYDSDYLNSLNKLWIKNNEKLPKKEEENKTKDDSNNSTINSSDSTDENKKHKKILSNSFQNMDSSISSDDEKQKTVKSI